MVIDTKKLLSMTSVARVTKEFIEHELGEPFSCKQQFISLDIEQGEKLLTMFTVNEVLAMMSSNCVANARKSLRGHAYAL